MTRIDFGYYYFVGKPYKHQSMFWSDLGPNVGYEALGISINSTVSYSFIIHLPIKRFEKLKKKHFQFVAGIIDSTLPTVGVFVKKPINSEASASESDNSKVVVKPVQAASSTATDTSDDFSKGVVFYLRDDKIVGIVLWNVFNRINTARAVLSQDKVYDDLNEVAKLFDLYL